MFTSYASLLHKAKPLSSIIIGALAASTACVSADDGAAPASRPKTIDRTPAGTVEVVRAEWSKPLDQRSVAPLEAQLSSLVAGLAPAAAMHVQTTLESPEFKQRTQEVFKRFDKDDNGVIDAQELPAALMYYDDVEGAQLLKRYFQVTVAKRASDEALDERARSISNIETMQWLQKLDVNGSGTVTPEEFDYLARLKFVTAATRLQTVDAMLDFAKYGSAAFVLGIATVLFLRSRRRAAAQRAAEAAAEAAAGGNDATRRAAAVFPLAAAMGAVEPKTNRALGRDANRRV